jgi:DNA-binding MarR family transcriptional regulator
MPRTTDKTDGNDASTGRHRSPTDVVASLRRGTREVQTFLTAQARASGLGLIEYLAVVRAAEQDGVTTREIARSLGIASNTMAALANRLERDGLVRRGPHPQNRRLVTLRATSKGQKLVAQTLGPVLADVTGLAEAMAGRDRDRVAAFIDGVTELLAEHANDAGPQPPSARSIPRRPYHRQRKSSSGDDQKFG